MFSKIPDSTLGKQGGWVATILNPKRASIIVLIFVLSIITLFIYDVRHQSTSEVEQKITIQDYVRQNISRLSPEREVLGGKFYVVSIKVKGKTGKVVYEDGHNAYIADFEYIIDEDGRPSVTSFKIHK